MTAGPSVLTVQVGHLCNADEYVRHYIIVLSTGTSLCGSRQESPLVVGGEQQLPLNLFVKEEPMRGGWRIGGRIDGRFVAGE